MITVIKQGNAYNRRVISLEGLFTDTKPVEYFIETDSNGVEVARVYIENGSIFTEIDTGDKYMFDAENKVWYKVSKNYVSLDEHGFVPLENLPPEIYERMYGVADDDARFDLTTDEVQNGDVVFVNNTQIMYLVVDETKLDSEDGYREFAAGIAAKAVADKDGNQIDTTYATKSEVAGKQDTIDSSHKLDADLVDDSNSTNKFTSAAEKAAWNGKQDAIDSNHKLDADLVDDSSATHKFATSAQLSQIATNQSNIDGQQNATALGGNGYAIINGIRLYVSSTAPTGDIPDGSVGVGGWADSHNIMGTSTDTITTPADIYTNDTTATVGMKGQMEQQSGTTTVPSESVTVSSLESGTNYALFPKADFPNAVVGDTINIVVSDTSYSQKVMKIDASYVYIENRTV